MPLRDHFHPPLSNRTSWEGFHGGWPMVIVQHLVRKLPDRYTAEPRVHSGSQIEIDVATFESENPNIVAPASGNGSAWEPTRPSVAVETGLLEPDEYEVRVYDAERGRRLVAAIEIVSPSNKDRLEHRRAFVLKCEALLRNGVSVSIIDLVTSRHFNLYVELLNLIECNDPTLGDDPPAISATACRWIERGRKHVLETWSHTLHIGQPLPTLPLWLAENYAIPLELEASYEETCRTLRIA
jgi:hypothetical protein